MDPVQTEAGGDLWEVWRGGDVRFLGSVKGGMFGLTDGTDMTKPGLFHYLGHLLDMKAGSNPVSQASSVSQLDFQKSPHRLTIYMILYESMKLLDMKAGPNPVSQASIVSQLDFQKSPHRLTIYMILYESMKLLDMKAGPNPVSQASSVSQLDFQKSPHRLTIYMILYESMKLLDMKAGPNPVSQASIVSQLDFQKSAHRLTIYMILYESMKLNDLCKCQKIGFSHQNRGHVWVPDTASSSNVGYIWLGFHV